MTMLSRLIAPTLIASAAAFAVTIVSAPPAIAQSSAYCDDYARAVANDRSDAGRNVLGGAAAGAIGGAILGGILDGGRGARRGALIGGGVGVVGGAAGTGRNWRYAYESAFDECMARGQVQPVYQQRARPKPWSDEWYDYCQNKYNSFRSSDGTFQPFKGPRRMCR